MTVKRLIFVFIALIAGMNALQAQDKEQHFVYAEKLLGFFKAEQYDSLYTRMDAGIKYYNESHVIKQNWLVFKDRYGNIKSTRACLHVATADYVSLQMCVETEYNIRLLFSCVFHPQSRAILSYSFVESFKAYVPPPYTDARLFEERLLDFSAEEMYPLKAVLTFQPGKKLPLVILVADAGPTEMDGGYDPNKPYKDIAWGLASRGIVVCRYNKRSVANGMNMLNEKYQGKDFTCRQDYLDDLYALIDTLKKQPEVDAENIFITGHGEGGMLAPLVASERKDVRGIIMLGAHAVSTLQMMIEQDEYIAKVLPAKAAQYEEQKKKAQYVLTAKLKPGTPWNLLPYDIQASYWLWLRKYDQVKTAAKLKKPILILHGKRDYQVSLRNYEIWTQKLASNAYASFKMYERLNHIFNEGDAASTYSEYFMPGNIPEYVVADIAGWLFKQMKKEN